MGLGLPGGAERRACERRPTRLDAGFEVSGEERAFECSVLDLSESGARLRTEVALHTGQRGILVMAPPDNGVPVVAVVRVVRTELDLDAGAQDAGVEFQDVSAATRSRLARLLVGLTDADLR